MVLPSLLRREHAATAHAGQSENGLSENKSRLKRNEQFAAKQIVRFSLFSVFAGFLNTASRAVRNCPHAGQAVPSGTPNEEFLTIQAIRSIARSTASTRGPRGSAVEERDPGAHRTVRREANRTIHPPIKRTIRNCPHAGRAVASATPSEWYYLKINRIRMFSYSGGGGSPIFCV